MAELFEAPLLVRGEREVLRPCCGSRLSVQVRAKGEGGDHRRVLEFDPWIPRLDDQESTADDGDAVQVQGGGRCNYLAEPLEALSELNAVRSSDLGVTEGGVWWASHKERLVAEV